MTTPGIKQRRLDWLSDRFHVSDESDILLWVGCAPYFEPIFEDIEFRALDITEATLTVLNALGIQPRLLADEKCCGHDALWTGDEETFKKLATHNAALIKETGVKKIIFTCPEGYRTLKLDYPAYGLAPDCELQHISEFLAERLEQDGLKLGKVDKTVTYQDPCRLGRHLGIYDAPRKVLQMVHSREDSICCGTSAFTNCDSYSNAIRKERLAEAASSGAETITTSCPKCQTHFRCAMVDKGEEKRTMPQLEVLDLVNLVAQALRRPKS
jgi:heterodisulfide reductase subunit D